MRTGAVDAARRAFLGLSRGVIRKSDDEKKMQEAQVEVLKGETIDGAERMLNYGFTAVPHDGAEAVVAFMGGNRDHPIVLVVGDRRYRLKGLAGGEVAIHDDQEQVVALKRSGIEVQSHLPVHVTSAERVIVEAPEVHLGGEGGRAVAVLGSVDDAGHAITGEVASRVFAV